MATVARIKKSGQLLLKGTVNERLPNDVSGAMMHFPFDGAGGGIDTLSGWQLNEGMSSGVNILDCLSVDWRDPANWSAGSVWDSVEGAFKFTSVNVFASNFYMRVDTTKHWWISATVKSGSGADVNLYLGTISYDTDVSLLPGHPGSYDYFGKVGGATPTTWTTYTNSVTGTARTGTDASTTNYSAFHPGTVWVRFLIIVDYPSATDTVWVKDLKWYFTDTPGPAPITEDGLGLSVERACYNRTPNGLGTQNTSNGGYGVTSNYFLPPGGVYRGVTFSGGNPAGTSGYWYQYNVMFPGVSTAYVISAKVRWRQPATPNAGLIRVVEMNWMYSILATTDIFSTSRMIPLDNGWFLVWGTITTNASTNNFTVYGYETSRIDISIYDLQVETGSTPTAYSPSFISRGIGYASIAMEQGASTPFSSTNGGSITFEVLVTQYCNGTVTHLIDNGAYGGAWFFFGINWSTNYAYMHEPNGGGATQTTTPINLNTWYSIAITWNDTNQYLWINGVMVASAGTTASTHISKIPNLRLGYPQNGTQGVRMRKLTLYNLKITDQQVMSLANSVGTISTAGRLITHGREFQEKEFVFDGYYHWPLADDTLEFQSKMFGAAVATNLAYEDGAVWVGTATTNLFAAWQNYSRPYSLGPIIDGVQWYKYTSGCLQATWLGNSYGYMGRWDIGPYAVGTAITFSYKGWVSDDCNAVLWSDTEGSGAPGLYGPIWHGSDRPKFQTMAWSTTWADAAATGVFLVYPSVTGNTVGAFNGHFLVNQPQIELKPFRTPSVVGTRGLSLLMFNFNASIGLDWSGSWSICYWKKPVGTYLDNMTSFSHESMGGAGAGATFAARWGKANSSNTITGTSVWGTYFGEWQFISLVKSGTTVTVTITGIDFRASYTFTGPTTATACVNTFGSWDFQLGGWDGGYPCNAYYRDLVVAQTAFSTAQLDQIRAGSHLGKTRVMATGLIEDSL